MYCPNCQYEYEDWATTCTDCGEPLEPGALPAPPAPPDPALFDYGQFRDWVIVTNVPNTFMGTVLKSQIEQSGVPVLMKRSRGTDIAEWSHNDFAMHDLYVPLAFARQARQLIDSPPTGGRPRWDTPDLEDEADLDDEGEDAADDLLEAAPPTPRSGWYLIDSGSPAPPAPDAHQTVPLPAGPPLPNAPLPLPSLPTYRAALDRRKSHRPAPPDSGRVLPFRPPGTIVSTGYDDDEYAPGAVRSPGMSDWTRSRIYRLLMGLLLLAWTLPWLLQLVQYFGGVWAKLIH